MEAGDYTMTTSHADNFRVDFITKSVVKAAAAAATKPHILSLSNLDLLSGRFPVTYFYFFQNPNHHQESPEAGGGCFSSSTDDDHLKASLSRCLSLFYPFAGRIVANPATAEPEICCDNHGVLVVEARANIPLRELQIYDLNKCLEGGKLVPAAAHQVSADDGDFAVQVQITRYPCGGVSLTVSFDHALGDASSFGKFLLTWSELARDMPPSCSPDHRRRFLLRPRFPPRHNTCLDDTFVSCTLEDIRNMPTAPSRRMLKRLYHVDASSIDNLQILSRGRTKIEAFSAYIWKVMATTIGGGGGGHGDNKCKMGWLVDGRRRMENLSEDYIGNVLSLTFGELTVEELKGGDISQIASHAHSALSAATNAHHFLDLIDWIELHRPGLMLSKLVLGRGDGGPALVVSSGRRFPVAELDFGFGGPVLGTVCTTVEKIGVGYVNQRESALGDGSWTVSAILWPEMVAALESDSGRVFRPMTAHLIHL